MAGRPRREARDSIRPALRPPPGLTARLLDVGGEEVLVFRVPLSSGAGVSELSSAEREVAELAVAGLSNREISVRRKTSERTVANQLANVFRKLNVGSRRALAVRMLRGGGG